MTPPKLGSGLAGAFSNLQSTPFQSHSHRQRRAAHTASTAYRPGREAYTSAGTPAGDSNSLRDYLKSPLDLAALGPRLAVGALLSVQEASQNLQKDLEEFNLLLQDPRPVQDKQQVLSKELESRVTTYLQRGAAVEAELLTTLTGLLPEDVQQQLPPELKDILLRGSTNRRIDPTPPTFEEAQTVPLASVSKSQTAAELEDLKGTVSSLRQTLADLRLSTDPAQDGVLKVNVVDARASLARKLQQLSPAARSVQDAPVQAALDEANILLREVDRLKL